MQQLFKNDLSTDSLYTDQDDSSLDNNPLALLETFGPGSFATPEEIASDEENDAKLWMDMLQSIQQWQRNKILKEQNKTLHHR